MDIYQDRSRTSKQGSKKTRKHCNSARATHLRPTNDREASYHCEEMYISFSPSVVVVVGSSGPDGNAFSPTAQPPSKWHKKESLPLTSCHCIPWELVLLVLASADGIEELR